MTLKILASCLLGSLLIFSSCKNDPKEEQIPTTEKIEFSQLSEEEKEDFNTSVWAKMATLGATNSFTRSSVSAGFSELLMNTEDITVFAPSNEAFQALNTPQKEIIQNPSNIEDLKKLLKSHIVPEALSTVDIVKRLKGKDALTLETMAGTSVLIIKKDMELYLVAEEGDTTHLIMSDVKASNGHIHIVDKVLFPK